MSSLSNRVNNNVFYITGNNKIGLYKKAKQQRNVQTRFNLQ